MPKLAILLMLFTTVGAAADANAPAPVAAVSNPELQKTGPRAKLWLVSVGAFASADVMDVRSSWGKPELNPALAGSNGTFGARGALLKGGIEGAMIGLEYLLLRHSHSAKLWKVTSLINFGAAGATAAVAARNWGIPAH